MSNSIFESKASNIRITEVIPSPGRSPVLIISVGGFDARCFGSDNKTVLNCDAVGDLTEALNKWMIEQYL